MKRIKESDTTTIMVPADDDKEMKSVLKKYAGVDKLECDKAGYCVLKGSQADLECVLEELGFDESIKEFEVLIKKRNYPMKPKKRLMKMTKKPMKMKKNL